MSPGCSHAEARRRGGWEVKYGKVIFTENKRKNIELVNLTILSLSYGKIVVKTSRNEGLVPAEYSSYQVLAPGDIVIRCTDLQNDQRSLRVGYVEDEGIITSAYLGLKVDASFDSKFIFYWLYAWDVSKEIYRYGSGLRQSLSWADLKYLPIPLPPLPEQKAIVAYLDAKLGGIDKAIASEEKMIALLQERREIIINEAVFPRNGWEKRRISWLMSIKSPISAPHEELLSVYLHRGVIRFSDESEKRTNATSNDLSKYQLVEPGEFVMNNQQAWRGSVGVSRYRGIVSPAYFVMRLDTCLRPDFANYLLRSRSTVSIFERCSRGVGTIQRNLIWDMLKVCRIAFPPLPEQETIAARLDRETAKIDRAIETKRQQIALLRERREIIIDEAVTGKVKVP